MLERLSTKFLKFISFLSQFTWLARLADSAIIALSILLCGLILDVPWGHLQTISCCTGIVLYAIFATFGSTYRSYREEGLAARIGRVCAIWAIVMAGLLLLAFVTKSSQLFSRALTLAWFTLTPTLLLLWHGVIGLLLRIARIKGHNARKAAIVGITEMSDQVAANLRAKPWMGIDIVGYFDDRTGNRLSRVSGEVGPYLGNYDTLIEEAKKGTIDMAYISLPMRAESRINQLINRLGCTTTSIYIAHDFGGFNLLPHNCAPRWNRLGNVSVLGVVESPFQGLFGVVKQVEDVLLGTVALAMLTIPMIAIAIAIKLTSKGPVFFRQTRYGLNGRKINVLKFRTMTVCENGSTIRQATKNDQRVTRVGAFLRRTSLDELPQFIHVVTGQMSIVGPRPHAVAHNEQYRDLIDHYMVRHKVKPGITGWAQVNGWRGETDTEEKMRKRVEHDLVYIRDWTLLFDLKIIFLTIFGAKTHLNAY